MDQSSLLLGAWVWSDPVPAHPVEQLAWHLHQSLLRQHVRVVLELVEGYELDDISGHVATVSIRVECLIVTIEGVHRLEVSIADSDDDDGKGQGRATDDFINSLLHVTDYTIGDDHQDVELLVHLVNAVRLGVVVHLVDNISKVGGSVEIAVLECPLVAIDNLRDAVDSRAENITVEGEAVRCAVSIGRHCATETVQVDKLVAVVELKDVSNGSDGLDVLVPLRVKEVQRIWRRGRTI